MNEANENRDLAHAAKALFDASVERLDAATLSRLNRSRHRVLEKLGDEPATGARLRWVPVTSVAAAALLTVMIMNDPDVPVPDGALSVSDFEMLLDDDNLELLEDLEFYLWLEAADIDADGNVG